MFRLGLGFRYRIDYHLASNHDDDVLYSILLEMCFFLGLLFISEFIRFVAKICLPQYERLLGGLRITSLVLSWYAVSITLILFNKFVITEWNGGGIPFPICYTDIHMVLKGMIASCYYFLVRFEGLPSCDGMTRLGLAMAGAMASLDIVTSNLSLGYISISFYTFLKSASVVFVFGLAVTTRVEPCSFATFGTVALVATGMCLSTYGETDLNWSGFGLVMCSELFAAIRWVVTQVMLQNSGIDAMTAVLYMAPASTLTLLPFAIAMEREPFIQAFTDMDDKAGFFGVLCFPGFLSFLLLLIECQLVKDTSSLTLTLFGNLKSVSTILFAILVFGERASGLQWCGLTVALAGMMAYSHTKRECKLPADSEDEHPNEETSLLSKKLKPSSP